MAQDLLQQLAKLAQGTSLGQRTGQRAGAKTKQELDKKEDLATMLLRLGQFVGERGKQALSKPLGGAKDALKGGSGALGALSTIKPGVEGDFQRGLKQAGQEFMEAFQPKTPLEQAALDETKKFTKEVVRSGLERGIIRSEDVLERMRAGNQTQSSVLRPQSQVEQTQQQTQQQVQPEQIQQEENPLVKLARFILDPGQVEQGKEFRAPSALGGLIRPTPSNLRILQQTAGVSPEQQIEQVKLRKDMLKEANDLQRQGMLKPQDIFTKFEQASEPFINLKDAYSRVTGVLTNPETGELDFESPIGDLDLLFGTAKTLDPSGRVTDSDIAIQEAVTGKYGDKIKKIAQKLLPGKGGVLLPRERRLLFEAATKRFQSAEKEQEKTVEQFKKLATKNQIPFENVIRDVGMSQNLGQQNQGIRIVSIRRRDENAPV